MAFKHKQKQIHIYIATPAYDGKVQTDFAMSLAETTQLATHMGIRVTVCIMRNNIFIDHARNHFARLFLASDATHLFFIDSDLKWEPRAVIGLATTGLPIVAGVYPKRQDGEPEYPARFAVNPDTQSVWVENDFVLCSRVPTGFLCIERKVMQEMWDDAKEYRNSNEDPVRRLFYTYINDAGTLVGEDFAFCEDYCKKYEQLIPVWPDLDFTHGERWTGNFHKYLNSISEPAEVEASAAA